VARDGLRQPAGWPRGLAAAVLAWACVTAGMEALGALGMIARGPLLGLVVLGLCLALACRLGRVRTSPAAGPPGSKKHEGWGWEGVAAVGLTLLAATLIGEGSLLLPVKVVSDGPIYHLPFAIRWWKAGRLELVAAPFGENAATYFPAVGDVWFCWLVTAWGGDRLARVGQAPFLLLAAMTAYALARRLGAGRPAALVATAWFVTCAPLLLFSFEANVDTLFIAGYLLAAYFFLRHALGDDGLPALALGALAAGCAMGTKAVGVVFVPPLLALGVLSALRHGTTRWVKLLGALLVAVDPLSVAGFWYARDAWLTGNPLYPLHLEAFGRVWLSGWYGPEVMRLSGYYMPFSDWRAVVDLLLAVLDPRLAPVWLAALGGAWAWRRPSRSSVDRWVWVASALAVVNVALFWVVVPYRTQQRFMLQALGLAAVPLARLFDRGRAVRALGVLLLAVHLTTPQSWPFGGLDRDPPWDLSPSVVNKAAAVISVPYDLARLRAAFNDPAALRGLALTAGLGAAAMATSWCWARASAAPSVRRWVRAALTSAGLGVGAGLIIYPWGADPRHLFFPSFPEYVRGWLELDMRAGPSGARVAYAGNDLPYYLMGVGLRNEVRYVNVDAHPGWLIHDYHRAASRAGSKPATWDYPRPGWDRIHPDYHAWLANLRSEGIQLLVVNRVNPAEGPHNVATADGFPIERRWADAHPETFEPLYGAAERDPQFRLYRVRSQVEDGPGRDRAAVVPRRAGA
jgi:hypothetical protein